MATFRADMTRDELEWLLRQAERQADEDNMLPLTWLYREKDPDYFNAIRCFHGNVMKVAWRIKDKNGDPRSPINGELEGLFFSANIKYVDPNKSLFGSRRLKICVETMYQKMPNLYFTDFYCNANAKHHYVTLVMTAEGSKADKFCQEKLILLDFKSNPFVRRDQGGDWHVTKDVWVEILCTEDIDITGKVLEVVEWDRKIRNKGIEKTAGCKTCNL